MAFSSISCPDCNGGMWEKTWNRETHEYDLLACTNCGHERDYHPKGVGEGRTPSQEKTLAKIRRYFEQRDTWHGAERRIKDLDWGPLSVVVRTHPETVALSMHHHFLITSRGKLIVLSVSGVYSTDGHMERVARVLGGHIEKG